MTIDHPAVVKMKTLDTLFEKYVGKTVEVLDTCPNVKMRGIQGTVVGVDPRPLGHQDGEWLCVKYVEGSVTTQGPTKTTTVNSYATAYFLPSHVRIV